MVKEGTTVKRVRTFQDDFLRAQKAKGIKMIPADQQLTTNDQANDKKVSVKPLDTKLPEFTDSDVLLTETEESPAPTATATVKAKEPEQPPKSVSKKAEDDQPSVPVKMQEPNKLTDSATLLEEADHTPTINLPEKGSSTPPSAGEGLIKSVNETLGTYEVSAVTTDDLDQIKHIAGDSILKDSNLFDVAEADAELGEGTIITDQKRQRWQLLPALKASLTDWFGELRQRSRVKKPKKPVHTVTAATAKAEVLEKAAERSALAPKDDFAVVAERLQDTERTTHTGSSVTIKAASTLQPPQWNTEVETDSEPAAAATGEPEAEAAVVEHEVAKLESALIGEAAASETKISPETAAKTGAKIPQPKPQWETTSDEATDGTVLEVPKAVTSEPADVELATILTKSVSELPDNAEPSVESEVTLEPAGSDEAPRWASETETTEGPATTEVEVFPTVETTQPVPPVAEPKSEAIPLVSPTPETEAPPDVADEPPAESIPSEETVPAPPPETIIPKPLAAPIPEPEPAATPSSYSWSPAPTTSPLFTRSVIAVAIVAIILGVGVSVWLFGGAGDQSVAETYTVPALVQSEEQTGIPLGSDAATFMRAILSVEPKPTTIIAHIYPTITDGSGVRPATADEMLLVMDIQAPAAFLRAIEESAFGLYRDREPFLVLKINSFDTALSGMLSWEERMSHDLSPLFGPPVSGTFDPRGRNASQIVEPYFYDTVIANHDARLLTDEQQDERLVYSFLNRDTILITVSSDALEAIATVVR